MQRRRLARLAVAPLPFETFVLGVIFVVVAMLSLLGRAQSDTWWHLRAGHDIWTHHRVSLTEHWSWTAAGREWPDHEWLWQAIFYALHSVGGMPLLALANALLATSALLLVLPRRGGLVRAVVLGAAAVPISTSWALRPQVASLFCFALILNLLARRRWVAVPFVMLLWANLHGAVATGGVVLVVLTIVCLVRRQPDARPMLAVTLASAIASLLTPLGWGLWRYVLKSPQRSHDNHIAEWANAFELTRLPLLFWLWLLAFVALAVWRRDRLRGWTSMVMLAAALTLVPMSASAVRNVAFFALATIPLLVRLLRTTPSSRASVKSGGALLALGSVLAAAVVGVVWAHPRALDWELPDRSFVAAVEHCPGRLFNGYDAGGVLVWISDVKVYVDSRQDPYPPEVLRNARRVQIDGDTTPLDAPGVLCAVLHTDAPGTRATLQQGWTVVASDAGFVLLRRDPVPAVTPR